MNLGPIIIITLALSLFLAHLSIFLTHLVQTLSMKMNPSILMSLASIPKSPE